MKIVALTSSFPFHARDERSIFIKHLYDAIAQQGVDLTVVSPHPYEGKLNYNFVPLKKRYSVFGDAGLLRTVKAAPLTALQLPQAIYEFASIAKSLKPDIIHANWSVCGTVSKLLATPTVVTLRGSDVHILKNHTLKIGAKLALKNAVAITAVGNALTFDASSALDKAVIVIENGTELVPPEPIQVPNRYFLSVGTVSAVKDTLSLVNAFAIFAREHESEHLMIAGRLTDAHYAMRCRRRIDELNLSERIHLLGAVSPGQVTTLLSAALAYCGFSISEGRPNAVLEAQLAGVPCLLSNITAHRDIATKNDTLIEATNAENAARSLNLVTTQGRHLGSASWTWNDCAKRYLDLFEACTRKSSFNDFDYDL